MADMKKVVTVTQADRDAAWGYGLMVFGSDPNIRDGKYDDSTLVQSFARHRIESVRAAWPEGKES